jgi:polysaccharide pyruvyl transferase WcaK-like protein
VARINTLKEQLRLAVPTNPSILILTDDSSNLNWGAWAMKQALDQMIGQRIHGAAVEWITRERLQTQYRVSTLPGSRGKAIDVRSLHGYRRRIGSRFSQPVADFPAIYDEFVRFGEIWERCPPAPLSESLKQAAEQASMVVLNGEGHIQANREIGLRSLFLLWYVKEHLKKPAAVIDHTTHLAGMARPIMQTIVQQVYPRLEVVTVRDPYSLKDLSQVGVSNAKLVPDVVFSLAPEAGDDAHAEAWLRDNGTEAGGYFCISAGDLPMDWKSSGTQSQLFQLIEQLRDLRLRPLIVAKDKYWKEMERISAAIDGVTFGQRHDNRWLWRILKDAAFLVTGHYHHLVAAAKVGCPFIAFRTDTPKIESLFELLGWSHTSVHDPTYLTNGKSSLVDEARYLLSSRSHISDELVERADHLASGSYANAEMIKACL